MAVNYRKAVSHRQRAVLCREYGVPNTGRQWRKLRKALGLAVRVQVRRRV